MPSRPQHTHRREILKGAAALGLAAALPRWAKLSAADAPAIKTDSKTKDTTKYNVLFIMSDDMRPELGCFGNPLVPTPNLNALAKAGVLFQRGYCQYPLCNPARTSMLTGRQVINTGIMGNEATAFFWNEHPDWLSLPRYFRENGYTTARTGKIFHFDDGPAWVVGGGARGATDPSEAAYDIPILNPRASAFGQAARAAASGSGKAEPTVEEIRRFNQQAGNANRGSKAAYSDQIIRLEGDGQGAGDYHTADTAIEYLRQYKDQPFFIGCGFVKPHSPPTAPQKYFDMMPLDKIQLPVDYATRRTLPEGFPEGCLRRNNADLFIGRDSNPQTAKEVIQAYYASVAWTDWNIGRVVGELDRLGLREKTIIVFTADHGYQLGEKGKWSKAGSLWEEGARVPLFIAAPGVKGNGQVCTRPVEALNIYPTVTELCNLPTPTGQEGHSMTKLLNDPKADWNYPAYTVWRETGQNLTGIGVRVENWRYAEYDLGGAMLLDMVNDPHQLKNLAHDPKYADVTTKMAELLKHYRAKEFPRPALAAPIPAATKAA